MPSPTSSTRPISWTFRSARNCSISCRRTETISSALSDDMAASLDQLVLQAHQLGADGAVEDEVADAHDHAPDQARVDPGFQHRLAPHHVAEQVQEALLLVVGQRSGGAHVDAGPVGALVEQV